MFKVKSSNIKLFFAKCKIAELAIYQKASQVANGSKRRRLGGRYLSTFTASTATSLDAGVSFVSQFSVCCRARMSAGVCNRSQTMWRQGRWEGRVQLSGDRKSATGSHVAVRWSAASGQRSIRTADEEQTSGGRRLARDWQRVCASVLHVHTSYVDSVDM